jgi:Fic family protein
LLIALLLEHWGALSAPLLYLSLFFKRHRGEYYRRLNAVRVEGDWEGWTDFFLDGVAIIADEAVASVRDIFTLVSQDRTRVLRQKTASVSAVRLFEHLPEHPILTVASAMKLLGTSKPTATRAIELLTEAGVLAETTGKKRDRSFAYQAYLDELRAGTELERG